MMADLLIPSSYSIPLPCPKAICCFCLRSSDNNTPVRIRIHLTLLLFFVIAFSVSARYISTFPLYVVLVVILYGPILLLSLLIHECGHLSMSRKLLGRQHNDIILWPFGGYTFCDGLSTSYNMGEEEEEQQLARGSLRDDIRIALTGPLTHVPMCLFWLAMYAAVNNGDISDFTFRNYLSEVSSGAQGFFSTLFKQACLLNLLLMWFNIFIPSYPLDGGRLITSTLLLMGVALNKAALLTCFASILFASAIFAWSIYTFIDDGVGITGVMTVYLVFFVSAECYRVYKCIVGGTLRDHPLFGRDCYIYRDLSRPSMFQMSSAARNIASYTDRPEGEGELDEHGDATMVPTETDIDQSITQRTDID